MKSIQLLTINLVLITLDALHTAPGKKLEVKTSLSETELNTLVSRNETEISLIQCAMLCIEEACGSYSYGSDLGTCYIYGKRFCSTEYITKAYGDTKYYIIDDNSQINGCDRPKDCRQIQLLCKSNFSGIYTIYPDGIEGEIDVYCDMEHGGGGWMVFQRRMDGSENFYRPWNDYKEGFGDICGEFWQGNDIIHNITSQRQYEMRVDMEDFERNTRYATYRTFSLGNEMSNYTLTVSGYKGNTVDCLLYHSGRPFSTFDVDNDIYSLSCSVKFDGAWWYGDCHSSNLNGKYLSGNTTTYANGVVWSRWKGYYYSLKTVTMKIRPFL